MESLIIEFFFWLTMEDWFLFQGLETTFSVSMPLVWRFSVICLHLLRILQFNFQILVLSVKEWKLITKLLALGHSLYSDSDNVILCVFCINAQPIILMQLKRRLAVSIFIIFCVIGCGFRWKWSSSLFSLQRLHKSFNEIHWPGKAIHLQPMR